MNLLLHQVPIALLFLCFLLTLTCSTNNPTHFTGDVSINCGSTGTFAARNGRKWIGDVMKPKLQIQGSSTTSTLKKKLISADPIPHKTARLSRSQFSYTFQVSPGQKILRLHFNPSPYNGFKGLKDLFTVEAGAFTLLGNFSASLTADALRVNSFSKEFCLNIQENKQLDLTFSPESSRSLDTYAFINGIEIISVPAGLSFYQGGDIGVQVVGQKSLVYVDHDTAIELIHRLNIKHSSVQSSGGFDDAFPMWALRKADKVKNETWKIAVDVGFRYMIRLHFSEMGLKVAASGEVVFKVLINEIPAQTNIDLVKEKDDENKIPRYRDYVVMMRGQRKEGKRDLSISLQSYDDLISGQGLLAGFEIFKLSNPDNSLASPNPLSLAQGSQSKTILVLLSVFRRRNAFAFVAIAVISLVNIVVHKLREHSEANSTEEENKPSARAEGLCRRFSLTEIQLATRNFSDGHLIGRGGFGKVYKGLIDRGQTTVAVKRLKPNSMQGKHEFLMEIETLSELRHVNLVSLIGYCNEHREMILVYDYMAGGTLCDHLYMRSRASNNSYSLTWKQRLSICIGAGRGLDYLHTGHGVIHRDVKTSNILLDENFVAKVSDFGLAKHEDRSKLLQSHISTRVKGTKGYFDPHYLHTHKLTRKTDTYAFGVVLFEILCGRPALDLSVVEDEYILTIWARDKINKGEVDQIVASSLREEMSPASLNTFVGIAERCLRDDPKNRPTMSQVVHQLELALEQHDNKQLLVVNETASASDDIRSSTSDGRDSASTGQSPAASVRAPYLTSPPEEQTNSQAVNDVFPSVRRATAHKPLRFWPLDAIWNRFKPSKRTETLSEIWDEVNIRSTKYDWDMIAAATSQFSTDRVIGRGGFGPVYKGVLPNGQLVAVKRLCPSSAQGLGEFRNEIHFLPNLQHPNIIKLLGYCIRREEKLLVYEFMENKSLDACLKRGDLHLMQWEVRFKIIKEIARGVVYLHQDSGLRIIHRNLHLGNILLDNEMNTKISNFAFARTLGEHQSEMETNRIVGTCACMSPEYAVYGRLSLKSDVYNFGIVMLEIVSGCRRGMHCIMSLRDHAWEVWKEGRTYDLIDKSLEGAFPVYEALRCIQVGVLCTQTEPNHRPAMPSVLKMLEGDEPLVEPQQEREYSATFELDDTLER
ncbi:putative receptor-like protein kinase at5g39000 [Phtheirospermum japonicum]|uniref:non-specific serine/threonine protein kinase n=1 Tax=Phtheirospermum japonicum TaxID=374723 RepID=A0A830CNS7_9LAMI|nr:putative receptor-like protein kinase at5g39000 [Phtheirospermum japonicum]